MVLLDVDTAVAVLSTQVLLLHQWTSTQCVLRVFGFCGSDAFLNWAYYNANTCTYLPSAFFINFTSLLLILSCKCVVAICCWNSPWILTLCICFQLLWEQSFITCLWFEFLFIVMHKKLHLFDQFIAIAKCKCIYVCQCCCLSSQFRHSFRVSMW